MLVSLSVLSWRCLLRRLRRARCTKLRANVSSSTACTANDADFQLQNLGAWPSLPDGDSARMVALLSLAPDLLPSVGQEIDLLLGRARQDDQRIAAVRLASKQMQGIVACIPENEGALGLPWGALATEIVKVEHHSEGEIAVKLRALIYLRLTGHRAEHDVNGIQVANAKTVPDWGEAERVQDIDDLEDEIQTIEALFVQCGELQSKSGYLAAGNFFSYTLEERTDAVLDTLLQSQFAVASDLPSKAIRAVATCHALVASLSANMRTQFICEPESLVPRLARVKGFLSKVHHVLQSRIASRREQGGGKGHMASAIWRDGELTPKMLEPMKEYGLLGKQDSGRLPVVHRRSLLSGEDINRILTEASFNVNRRIGGYHRTKPNGPWSTWYLHTGGWFCETFPEICERLTQAVIDADHEHWGLFQRAPCASRLGRPVLRCVELHTVEPGGSLPHPEHIDLGSLWTLDIMLSDPGQDFKGGQFCTLEADGCLRRHEFGRGDAVTFVSHKRHCGMPVTHGRRQVLVLEFWHGEQRNCAHRCCQRWGDCNSQVRDHAIQQFQKEAMTGCGSYPSETSPLSALLVSCFRGTGPLDDSINKDDIMKAIANLREQMKIPSSITKGGPRFDATDSLEDDGRGWVWLSADTSASGTVLEILKSVPHGKRPLLVARSDNVDSVFQKLDWQIVSERLDGQALLDTNLRLQQPIVTSATN